jgi:choline dehydrogenase
MVELRVWLSEVADEPFNLTINTNPLAPVVIRNNYLQYQSEMDVFIEGINMAREIAHAQGLANFKGEEIWPGQNLQSKKELEEYIRMSAIPIAHPSCTCKMGLDRMAVVDPELRVQGIAGLRVADASIMPEIINSPTNATCIMIGEKAADFIKQVNPLKLPSKNSGIERLFNWS